MRARSSIRLAVVVGVTIALLVSGTVAAKDKRELTVMTRNLYLGADIAQVLTARTFAEFVSLVAATYTDVVANDFPTRARAIAAEIDAAGVDIVGLQEVSSWTSVGPGAPPSYDYLAILLDALADRGLSFSVAALSNNLKVGPVPLALCDPAPAQCGLSYEDRDAILVNDDAPGLVVSNGSDGRFAARVSAPSLLGPIPFLRGWTAIDAQLDGKPFRLVNTHLEIEDFAAVQEAQGAEFLAGPANRAGAVIAVGDFNSAADGSTTTTYADLTEDWFVDAWNLNPGDPGLTCCQNATLSNPTSILHSRIDLVLTHGPARALAAEVVGDTPFQAVAPFWPSDHAGVVADIRLH